MISSNITRDHILKAIREINLRGVPPRRKSRDFLLVVNGNTYPPKYTVSLANKFANGEELNPELFSGGEETNTFLKRLGFKIVGASRHRKTTESKLIKKKTADKRPRRHNERCPECKSTIERMFKKIYGDVRTNYKFKVGTTIEDYKNYPFHQDLREILLALQSYRGYKHFVRTPNLPRCDFFIPNPGFIVEFDESQHFTTPRQISLQNYPQNLRLGFPVERWVALCRKIKARDNDPPFRDEQRAWYDTLRDFLPLLKGLKPTVRLFSKDFHWCSLNPEIDSDVKKFKAFLKGREPEQEIEVRLGPNPSLSRIVIAGEWAGDVKISRRLLKKVCEKWPKGEKVDCLVTCGAFLTFEWPKTLTNFRDNICPGKETMNSLTSEARKQCDALLDKELVHELRNLTKYITIGIDSYKEKISLSNVSIRQPHVELVAIVDLKSRKYFWTGKSYPTAGQENGLVRFEDSKSHFVRLPIGRVFILGCHDLNIFSRRGAATTKKAWRKAVREEFYDIVKREAPEIVLHHPHTTDSSRSCTAAWNELVKLAPTIKRYISAGRYYGQEGVWSSLGDVLAKTKLGNTIDFIVRT